ncbi:MAG: Rid family hydrolase [Acidimicrobiales bacterium]|jgi:enamine deaminase RidA (YjgF/YER057c/UK114 family)
MTERGPVIPADSQASYDRFHFAPAYRVGDTLYVSGVIGSGESLADEFAGAFANLANVLDAAGYSLADVVEMTSFHVDMSETLGSFMKARDAAMTEPWPAWTAIGCTELAIPTGRAEVKVTAVKQS